MLNTIYRHRTFEVTVPHFGQYVLRQIRNVNESFVTKCHGWLKSNLWQSNYLNRVAKQWTEMEGEIFNWNGYNSNKQQAFWLHDPVLRTKFFNLILRECRSEMQISLIISNVRISITRISLELFLFANWFNY